MDKTKLIGMGLILALVFLWAKMNGPTEAEIQAMQQRQDSLNALQEVVQIDPDGLDVDQNSTTTIPAAPQLSDSMQLLLNQQQYGAFSTASIGKEETYVLENTLIRLEFSNKGGQIQKAVLKEHMKSHYDTLGGKTVTPVELMEDIKNKMYFSLPLASGKKVNTDDLFFSGDVQDSVLTLTATAQTGGTIIQQFTLGSNDYHLDHLIRLENLRNVINSNEKAIAFHWTNYPDKLERNTSYERNYSTIYYKEFDEDVDNCSCTGDDIETLEEERLEWISHNNQFFNSTIMSYAGFSAARNETVRLEEGNEDLKKYVTDVMIPIDAGGDASIDLDWYIGPNEYDRLKAYGNDLEYVIPYGSSIFGTINRYIIRPLFNLMSGWIGIGLGIILLTFIVKLILYPLSYKMYHSQAKMRALKPELDAVREKFKDEPQKMQMEVMKEQGKYGVSMAQGCLPMVLQMPIWFALYRFFPANIDFRQESFLWADDLSSYEVFARLPFEIPFYGSHVSLFAVLWAASVLFYSIYNQRTNPMQQMSGGGAMAQNANMMKYMMYLMPISFVFFFNSFASGLTIYMFISSILNLVQTVGTKNYFNDDKLRAELMKTKEKKAANPKKKSGFAARFEEAMRQSQEMQKQREAAKKKKG